MNSNTANDDPAIIYLGFDPGVTGAMARYFDGDMKAWNFPLVGNAKHKEMAFRGLIDMIKQGISEVYTPGTIIRIAIEDQHFFPSDGKDAIWTAAIRYGKILNALALVSEDYQMGVKVVTANAWKTRYNLIIQGEDRIFLRGASPYKVKKYKKEKTAKEVGRRYPGINIRGPKGGLNDGMADAIMIATWAKDMWYK